MKKSMKSLLLGCFAFLFAFILLPAVNAEAADVTQTGARLDAIDLTWVPEEDALRYHISLGVVDENYKTNWTRLATVPATQTTYTVTNLTAGCEYYVKVEYDWLSYSGTTTYTNSIGTLYDAKTLPGKVTNVKQSQWWYFAKSFDVEWDRQTAAEGYEYKVKTSSGKNKASGTVGYNSLSVSKIKNTMVYTVQVRAYTTINGQKFYGDWSNKCYCFTQPRITSIKQSGKQLKIKWGKVNGATGYDIYMSTKQKKGYKKVKSVGKNTTSATITKLKGKKLSAKKTYYFYVVTKKKVGKTTYKSGKLYYWNNKKSPNIYGYF